MEGDSTAPSLATLTTSAEEVSAIAAVSTSSSLAAVSASSATAPSVSFSSSTSSSSSSSSASAISSTFSEAAHDPVVLRERLERYRRIAEKQKEANEIQGKQLSALRSELAVLQPFSTRFSQSLLAAANSTTASSEAVAWAATKGGSAGSFTVIDTDDSTATLSKTSEGLAPFVILAKVLISVTKAPKSGVLQQQNSTLVGGPITAISWYCLSDEVAPPLPEGQQQKQQQQQQQRDPPSSEEGTPPSESHRRRRYEWYDEATILAAHPHLKEALAAYPCHAEPSQHQHLQTLLEEGAVEHRRYRVRAEALLRQRDGEVAAAREELIEAKSRGILSAQQMEARTMTSSWGTPDNIARGGGGEGSSDGGAIDYRERGRDSHPQALRTHPPSGSTLQRLPPSLPLSSNAVLSGSSATTSSVASLASASAAGISRMADLEAQIAALLQWQQQARSREEHMRERLGEYLGELESYRQMQASGTPTFASSSSSSGSAVASADPTSSSSSSSATASSHALAQELSLLRLQFDAQSTEFTGYRKRAGNLVRERDQTITKLNGDLADLRKQLRSFKQQQQQQLLLHQDGEGSLHEKATTDTGNSAAVGGGERRGGAAQTTMTTAPTSSSTSSSASPSSSSLSSAASSSISTATASAGGTPATNPFTDPRDPGRWMYFRHIMLRYLAAPQVDASVRHSLEPAIMAVMGLSSLEVTAMKAASQAATRAAEEAAAASSISSAVTNFFGGFLGGGGGGAPS